MELKKPDAVRNSSRPFRFTFPHEVVDDPSLSLSEKRSILSQWASDACAVESFPTLRWLPGTTFPMTFAAVMDARDLLDRRTLQAEKPVQSDVSKRVIVADFARKREHRAGN
jgi:hypothetical protein